MHLTTRCFPHNRATTMTSFPEFCHIFRFLRSTNILHCNSPRSSKILQCMHLTTPCVFQKSLDDCDVLFQNSSTYLNFKVIPIYCFLLDLTFVTSSVHIPYHYESNPKETVIYCLQKRTHTQFSELLSLDSFTF